MSYFYGTGLENEIFTVEKIDMNVMHFLSLAIDRQ